MCIYIYIYRRFRGVAHSGNRYMSSLACLRTCAPFGSPSEFLPKWRTVPFPFAFGVADPFLLPCENLFSLLLEINEIRGTQLSPSEVESKRMIPSEIK